MTEPVRPPVRSLADGFPPADLAAWRARAADGLRPSDKAEAVLADALVRRTLDGVARGPLMTRADRPPGLLPDESRRRDASPAAAPGEVSSPWDLRVLIDHPDPARAGALALEALEGGATSLELRIDPRGVDGIMIRAADDLARALDGVRLDLAPVALDAGSPPAAALLAAYAAAAGADKSSWRGAFNLDPLGALAAGRTAPMLGEAADWALWAAEAWPRASAFRADGRVVHEAGGTEAQEIAFAASAAASYLEAMATRGLTVENAARRIVLAVALDADVHLGIAKLRALRRVWRRIATACGASADAARAPICAFSSQRMMTRIDPWTNLVRLTAAGFAGAVGGADALTLAPLTAGRGGSSALARRLSRGIELLLAEESGLARVADPARGGFHHEALTDALARRAWDEIQAIARAGGLAAHIESGALKIAVDAARAKRLAAIERGDATLVGVTDFRAAAPDGVETEAIDRVALRAEADARSARRKRAAIPEGATPEDLIRLAASGAELILPSEPAARPAFALAPMRLAEPFEHDGSGV
jgi:methylmalonyl-CoA mutase